MIQAGSIVKCIKGVEGVIKQGDTYTVWSVTTNGHIKLEEIDPPSPYNCFNKNRFEHVGELALYEEDVSYPFSTEEELADIFSL